MNASDNTSISRRGFLSGAALASAGLMGASLIGCAQDSDAQAEGSNDKADVSWDKETDVIVVGSGAGLMAAIVAAEKGSDVILLEKRGALGGQTTINEAWITAGCGSKVQIEAGVDDSIEQYWENWKSNHVDFADFYNEEVCKTLLSNTGKGIDKLVDYGLEFVLKQEPPYQDVPRIHLIQPNASTWALDLKKVAEEKGVEILTETPATKLITDAEEGVIGVITEKGENIKAKQAVILATGDFSGNTDFKEKYYLSMDAEVESLTPDNTGDGQLMAMAIGADTSGSSAYNGTQLFLEHVWGVESYFVKRGLIYVNKEGKRYADETSGSAIGYANQQTDKTTYIIWGREITDIVHRPDDVVADWYSGKSMNMCLISGLGPAYYEDVAEKDVLVEADTIEELAEKLGLDASTLKETIDTWNASVEAGEDSEFGRIIENAIPGYDDQFGSTRKIATPPFCALTSTRPACIAVSGPGLIVNTEMNVIDVFGEAIPRLYAAGMGVLTGMHIPSTLHGESMGYNVSSALIAGEAATAESAWQ